MSSGRNSTEPGALRSPAIVGNRNSNVFHRPECKNLRQMSEKNRIGFDAEAAALAEGFTPCQLCRP